MKKALTAEIPPHPKDPVQSNPAPVGHPAHEIWEAATRTAEEKLFRFEMDLAAEHPSAGQDPGAWLIRLWVGTFQIWAQRGLCIVCNYRDARSYEKWLLAYRQAYLEMLDENPPARTVPSLLRAVLANELLRAARYWSANAIEEVTARQNLAEAKSKAADIGAQIQRLRKECKWSLDKLSDETDIDKSNISRHISGKVRPTPRACADYAKAFQSKLGRTFDHGTLAEKPTNKRPEANESQQEANKLAADLQRPQTAFSNCDTFAAKSENANANTVKRKT